MASSSQMIRRIGKRSSLPRRSNNWPRTESMSASIRAGLEPGQGHAPALGPRLAAVTRHEGRLPESETSFGRGWRGDPALPWGLTTRQFFKERGQRSPHGFRSPPAAGPAPRAALERDAAGVALVARCGRVRSVPSAATGTTLLLSQEARQGCRAVSPPRGGRGSETRIIERRARPETEGRRAISGGKCLPPSSKRG